MTSWQKRLRVGLAVFGIVFAGVVYRSIGERKEIAPPPRVDRQDPASLIETGRAELLQERRSEREFRIRAEQTVAYQDGSAKQINVEITVPRPQGEFVVITAREAVAGPNEIELKLTGDVKLSASDGFQLTTDHGTFNRNTSVATVPGDVSFRKGMMSGSGRSGTYDQKNDVLKIAEQAKVTVIDDAGRTTLDGSAGTVTLDRLNDLLFLESQVHVLRGTQVIDSDIAMARLSSDEDVVTFLELRSNASVRGGDNSIESMKADAIDLDYTDDGTKLEGVVLNGNGSMTTAADEAVASRSISGGQLNVQMASDGSVAAVSGSNSVRLDLPATRGGAARSVRAQTLMASGEKGRGLTDVTFQKDVVFEEVQKPGTGPREARSQSLQAKLDGEGINDAFFGGGVTFTDGDLRAGASDARYQPTQGLLTLAARDKSGRPTVTDEHIRVEANTMDVALEGHGIAARGNVRTLLTRQKKDADGGRLPGLLKQEQPASVNAERLDSTGSNGRAEYVGNATLVQGDTAIRGERIVLDRQKGDLLAAGAARSTLVFEAGRTEGRADEIRYDDKARTLTYSSEAITPKSEQGTVSTGKQPPVGALPVAQVSGPDGDLTAERIEVVLASEANKVERLEAYNRVSMKLSARTAVGGRLTYHASEERYVMSGANAAPVVIRESCRETSGRTLTFFKSTDRIVVDGNETRRVETRPCTPPPVR